MLQGWPSLLLYMNPPKALISDEGQSIVYVQSGSCKCPALSASAGNFKDGP